MQSKMMPFRHQDLLQTCRRFAPTKWGKSLLVTCDKLTPAPYYGALIDAGNETPDATRLLFFFMRFFEVKIKDAFLVFRGLIGT